jgi:hypothetical protein
MLRLSHYLLITAALLTAHMPLALAQTRVYRGAAVRIAPAALPTQASQTYQQVYPSYPAYPAYPYSAYPAYPSYPASGDGVPGAIQNSTLVRPVIINSTVQNSTLVNPVIISPQPPVAIPQPIQPVQIQPVQVQSSQPGQVNPTCLDFSALRVACQPPNNLR